jgi:PleD family two-component response regulator
MNRIQTNKIINRVRAYLRQAFPKAAQSNSQHLLKIKQIQQLQEYTRSLEQQVRDRAAALDQEIQQRQAVEAALQAANQELKDLAYLDCLTQIGNRRRFDDQLIQEWHRLKREQLPLSLILCDIDYFTAV